MAYDDSLEIDARVNHSRVPKDMDDTEEEVKDGAGKAAKAAESGMKKFQEIFSAAAVAAGQAIYSIGEKAKDSVVSMLTAGDDYNKAMNQLSASTGATGEELENLKDVAKGVFSDNYGESIDYLDRICEYLDCSLMDLIEYVPNKQKKTGRFLIKEPHGNRKK